MSTVATETVITQSGILECFSKDVDAVRSRLLVELQNLPPSLASASVTHYLNWSGCERILPMLSEYAPWLLADYLSIEINADFEDVALAWMMLNAHILFLDDIVDVPKLIYRDELLISSTLIFQRSLGLMARRVPTDCMFQMVNKYLNETAAAAAHELDFRKSRTSNHAESHNIRPGQKIAYLKLCAEMVSHYAGRGRLAPGTERCLDLLTDGMQIIDDILDWQEDSEAGQMNPFLEQASFSHAAYRNDANIALLAALVTNGVLGNFLSRADAAFQDFTNHSLNGDSALIRHIKTAQIRIEQIKSTCQKIKHQMDPLNSDGDHYYIDEPLKEALLALRTDIQGFVLNGG
jgi:hypothetical protein